MKKIISLLLVLIVALGLLAGCGGKKEDGSNNSSTSGGPVADPGILSKADVAFVDANGESVYRIIRPEEPTLDEATKAGYVYKQMKDTLGVTVKNVSDAEDGTDVYEILIGSTNRPESQQAMEYMAASGHGRYDDYIICTIGKKIVINANNAEALDAACKYFVENCLKTDGIKGGIEYIYAAQGDFKDITVNNVNIGLFKIVRPHFNFSYLPQTEAEKLVDYVYQTTGYKLDIVHDEYVEPTEYEIIIGNADREGVTAVTNYDEYNITVSGKKIYLNGGSPHATAMAVSEFAKQVKAGSIADANTTTGSYEAAMANYDRATTYYPTWYDTFDTEGIDTTKWHIMNDPEFSREGQNGKWSAMTNSPNQVFQTNGNFYIYGAETDTHYYGGTITNKGTMAFQYGYVEKSAIVPDGPGFWSLLWFCGTGDGTNVLASPEIDLNECFGEGRATQANCHAWPTAYGKSLGYDHTSLDGATYGNDKKVYCPDEKTFAEDYHTYGFLWDQEYQAFYLDGEEWFRYKINTTEWDIDCFVNSWMYMQLSFSVGRLNNGLLCENLTEYEWQNTSHFAVDWLYLYQFEDGIQGLKIKN